MTAHPPKPVTLTPEVVARFADYKRREGAWGVLHVSLEDGNYECKAADLDGLDEWRLWQLAGTGRARRLTAHGFDVRLSG